MRERLPAERVLARDDHHQVGVGEGEAPDDAKRRRGEVRRDRAVAIGVDPETVREEREVVQHDGDARERPRCRGESGYLVAASIEPEDPTDGVQCLEQELLASAEPCLAGWREDTCPHPLDAPCVEPLERRRWVGIRGVHDPDAVQAVRVRTQALEEIASLVVQRDDDRTIDRGRVHPCDEGLGEQLRVGREDIHHTTRVARRHPPVCVDVTVDAHAHSLIAPAVRPFMNHRCRMMNSTMGGTIAPK